MKKKRKKRGSSAPKVDHERSLEFYMENFKEFCEKCGEPLDVIKHRPRSNGHREVVAAVCSNKNYKGNNFKCELYQIEIRFIERFL
jgi:hypothetical protein